MDLSLPTVLSYYIKRTEIVMNIKENIILYRPYLLVFAGLIALTLIAVLLTQIYPCAFTVVTALLIAAVNAAMVLRFFMHYKFKNQLLNIMLVFIALLISLLIVVTL